MRLLVLLLGLAAAASAQPATVSGRVLDASGQPLAGASVYLSGTTRGDAADADGRFEIADVASGAYRLVGSMLGFVATPLDLRLRPGEHRTVTLRLAPATVALGGVAVEAPTDRRWQGRLAWFTRVLLGESGNAAETRILNPEVLDFRVRWGTLTATAAAPLEIENRALGYRLRYDLHTFSASSARIRYDGDEVYEPLPPASPHEAARWDEARERAYRGSLRHLLRALLAGSAEAEGFRLTLSREDPFHTGMGALTVPVGSEDIIQPEGDGWGALRFRGTLHIVYGEEEDPRYLDSEWFQERRRRPAGEQRSTVGLAGPSARIDPQGTPEDPFAVWTSGYLGFERLADEVPEDYVSPGDA